MIAKLLIDLKVQLKQTHFNARPVHSHVRLIFFYIRRWGGQQQDGSIAVLASHLDIHKRACSRSYSSCSESHLKIVWILIWFIRYKFIKLQDIDEDSKGFVNWLTAANSQGMKQNVVETLLCAESRTRIMITTSLLSLGVDMKGELITCYQSFIS